MPKDRDIKDESFDAILLWLDPDREKAALKYEDLRLSLIRILGWHSCVDAAGLADEVFSRVACKIEDLIRTYEGDPRLYFYAVANNLVKEYQRHVKLQVPLEEVDLQATEAVEAESDDEPDSVSLECFRKCLKKLSRKDRDLILAYYQKDKQAKINHRKEMAARLRIEPNALRVKMHRIRMALEKCIEECTKEANHETD